MTQVSFPTSAQQAAELAARGAVVRAGATDVTERRRLGLLPGDLCDLRDAGLDVIGWDDAGAARLGARVRLAHVASDPRFAAAYPGYSQSVGALATPQIRAVATLGGSLLQEVRCWYFRREGADCLKTGGASCPARAGDHLYGVCFDRGPCVAPHASTPGMAALAYEARVRVVGPAGESREITAHELYGDGSDPRRVHTLRAGEVLAEVRLAPPTAGERAAYHRAIARARAEWALVEALARVVLDDAGAIRFARVAVGAVATVPLRLAHVEDALVGRRADAATLAAAADRATEGAAPLPMTGYKLALLRGTVLEVLERATGVAQR